DGGPRKGAATERMCVVSRDVKPVEDLLRFVVDPDGSVVADIKRNLPGRGLWISANRDAIEQAVKRNLFAKGFKRDVKADPGLAETVGRLLERSALDALAIAGKAGEVATGFSKVEVAIGRGGLIGLLHASDGSEDGLRKLEALLRRNQEEDSPEIPVIRAFSGMQLDLALGRSNVIHAALLAGPASQGFLTRCQRMLRFRTGETLRPGSDRVSGREPKVIESGTESE
ncbi:MAG: RNA-binding protein, partial [Pseudorhodoplanes sp.]